MADLGTVDDTAALRQLLQEALDEFDDDNDVLERAPPAAGVPSGPADDSGVAYAFSTPPRRLLAGAGQQICPGLPASLAELRASRELRTMTRRSARRRPRSRRR